MNYSNFMLFSMNASREFGHRVSKAMGVSLSEHEERDFEDGEHKSRPLVSVRGRDVYVVQSLYGDTRQSVNDKLCRLLFFIGALHDASAASITAVIPYLCYARKDRKTKPRDPVTTRYVARMFEAVGTNRVVTLDVHNLAAFQNAFQCHTDHLEAKHLFANHFAPMLKEDEITVMSPDIGGIKRAELFKHALSSLTGKDVSIAFMEKLRSGGVLSGETLVGEVKDKTVIIIDDMISTGTTILRAATACRKAGARNVHGVATHGVFLNTANETLSNDAIDSVVVTDTILPFRLNPATIQAKLRILDIAPLFAEAINRIHQGGSLTDLLEHPENQNPWV